jgi:PIN domain nuclease of toxin-antitoxin system
MNLLLDTHTYIWFAGDKPELSPVVKQLKSKQHELSQYCQFVGNVY